MITGMHGLFYVGEAAELRTFLRDRLELPCRDVGGGWLVFDFDKADLGVHPTGFEGSPPAGTHQLSFTCDDIHATVARLRANGVPFTDDITERRYGTCIHIEMPGGGIVELYQPKY